MKKILSILVLTFLQVLSVAKAQSIINWHEVTARSQKNGVDTNDIIIFNIRYTKGLSNEKDSCHMTITELKNLNCYGGNSAYIEKPRVMTSKEGLSCNVVQKNRKYEQAVISYVTNMETTLITVGYDNSIFETVEFEGSSQFSYPNMENIKIKYLPLKSKKGYVDGVIGCGKISLRTLKAE